MLTKTLCVVFLAILTVSLAKEEDIVKTILTSGTNIMKETAKVISNDPGKYSVDLNDLYKKYEVQEKADQARNFLLTQFKRGIDLSNEYMMTLYNQINKQMKEEIENTKKTDPILAEKEQKWFEKKMEWDKMYFEGLGKSNAFFNADVIVEWYNDKTKAVLQPIEQKGAEVIKKLEAGVLEVIKKNKNKIMF